MISSEMSPVLNLPKLDTLCTGRTVIVDYMTDNQLTETYHMIQEAAKKGEGYGIDEFYSEEEFRDEIKGSNAFVVKCAKTGSMLAGVIVAVSRFYRGHGLMADPFIIVKRSERKQKLGEFAMRKAIYFARRLGYTGMYVDTFSNNTALLRIIDKIGGFIQVGFLPIGGKLQDGKIVGSVIFYQNFVDENNNQSNLNNT